MATDEKNNYWEQTPDEQPLDGQQPSVNAEPEPLQPDESSVAQSPVVEDTPDNPPITWTAQEYVHLDKGTGWFVLFVLIVLGLVAIDIFLLKSWTFSALVVVMAVAIIIYIRRPPRTLTYALSPTQGLYVGEQLYHFDEFKAFGIIKDGDDHSIMLIPRKRFSPGVSVFFPEEAGERIVDILGQRLPIEELKLDIVDLVVRKLRL
ncbi:MAG: hypothetical protein JWO54_153 [Candidatus Saccharibacteria bacterium]|nr:hypothetical protein [Candidatus Saccharibacteria bacterium]